MKKNLGIITVLILIVTSMLVSTAHAETRYDNEAEMLNKYSSALSVEQYFYYSLYDIDKNGVPELILYKNEYPPIECDIYTLENDGIVYVGSIGFYRGLHENEKGELFTGHGMRSHISYDRVILENNNLLADDFAYIEYVSEWIDDEYIEKCTHYGKTISADEFSEIEGKLKNIEYKDVSKLNKQEICGTLKVNINQYEITDFVETDIDAILTLDEPQEFFLKDSSGNIYSHKLSELEIMTPNYPHDVYSFDGKKVCIKNYDCIIDSQGLSQCKALVYGANIEVMQSDIIVKLDGENLSFEQQPIIVNERTLVPLRAIFESLGAKVNWVETTRTVISKKGDTEIKMTIGDPVMYVNNNPVTLDVPPQIVNDFTLVPVRAVAESFGCSVDWNGENKTVIISSIDKDAVIEYAKMLCESNEKSGGLKNFNSYFQADMLAFESIEDIDKALLIQDFTLDMVSAGTSATITAAKIYSADVSSIKNAKGTISSLLTNDEIVDAAAGMATDIAVQNVFDNVLYNVPNFESFISNLGKSHTMTM